MSTQTPPPTPGRRLDGRSSRFVLGLFATLILLMAGTFVATGLYLRRDIQHMGGPLHVYAENRHDEKVRVDFYLRGQFAVLELEPGRGGMIRFNPAEVTPLEIMLMRRSDITASVVEEGFQPGREEDVTVIINSPTNLRVTRSLRAGTETAEIAAELPE